MIHMTLDLVYFIHEMNKSRSLHKNIKLLRQFFLSVIDRFKRNNAKINVEACGLWSVECSAINKHKH